MRISRLGVHFLGALALVGMAGQLRAQPITLGSGSNVSASATGGADFQDPTTTDDVTGLPYSNTTSETDGNASSSVDANLSTSSFNLGYTQSISLNTAVQTGLTPAVPSGEGSTQGDADIFFTAGSNASFSLSGYQTVTGMDVCDELNVYLYDATQGTYVYDYDQTSSNGAGILIAPAISLSTCSNTLTLDTSGGPLSGALTAGDNYEFYASESMSASPADPNLTGNVTLNLSQSLGSSVPLPRSAPAALLPLLLAGLIARRRVSAAN
jgi:hypothetical protein